MKSDSMIQSDVMQELKWDPSVTHEHIGVAVKDGIVTLTGTVPNLFEKFSAERATQRVSGVRAVVEKIEVQLPGSFHRDDQDLAQAILNVFRWNVQIPETSVQATVSNGWVTLTGEVDWEYQKTAAENSVRELTGVRGMSSQINIREQVQPIDIRQKIEAALRRAVEREAEQIDVSVQGSKVTLTGRVRSLADLRDVKGAVWGAPGVTQVVNKLTVAA